MGHGSSSHSTNNATNNTNIVTNSDLNVLNEQINSSITESIMNVASSCASSANAAQTIALGNVKTAGAFNFGATQSNSTTLSFSCINSSEISNIAESEMFGKMANAVGQNFSAEALNNIAQNAKTSSQNQFGATGTASANSNSNTNNNFNSTTNINQDIKNVLKNTVQNNTNIKNVSNCISAIGATQNVGIGDIDATSANINIDQSIAIKSMTECVNKSNVANNAIAKAASELGLQVVNTNAVKSTTSTTQEAVSDAKNVGVAQSLGEGASQVLGTALSPINNLIKGVTGSANNMMLIYILCCCCCILLIILAGAGYYASTMEQQ